MTRALTLLAVAALSFLSTAAAGVDDTESVRRAREELARRLHSAGADGAISVKGDALTPAPAAIAPALREGEVEQCLTVDLLAQTEQRLIPDKAAALDRLRSALLAENGDDRTPVELALARAYLVLGFASEARAIASVRAGPEARGILALALLAEGDGAGAAIAIGGTRDCGSLVEFAADAAASFQDHAHQISPRSMETLEALPQPLRQAIAEALAVASLELNRGAARTFISLAGVDPATPTSELITAVTEEANATASTEKLAVIAATPGPLRAAALTALDERIDATASAAVAAGYEADLAETAQSAPLSQALSALNLPLADRRAARGDLAGAAQALGAAWRADRTRKVAAEKFAAIVRPMLASKNLDARLSALAALSAEPQMSGAVLMPEDLRAAGLALAELGAKASVERILQTSPLAEADKALIASRADIRSGRIAEGRAKAMAAAADQRIARLLLETAYADGETDFELSKSVIRDFPPSVVSGAYWRAGDFEALLSLPAAVAADPVVSERSMFAYLAVGRKPPASLSAAMKRTDDVDALFGPVPDEDRMSVAAMNRVVEMQNREIELLRTGIADE